MIHKTLDEKISFLFEMLIDGISRYVPESKRRFFKNAWWNKKLQNLKNKKNKEWKRYKLTGDKSSYDRIFAEFDALNTLLYQRHVNKLKSSLKHNPSSFWRLVNSKQNLDSLPKLLHNDTRSSMIESEQAEMFAEFFNANFNTNSTT